MALDTRRLRRFCRELRVGMHFTLRKVPEHKAHPPFEMSSQQLDSAMGLTTDGAFEIPILDERHRGVSGPQNVVRVVYGNSKLGGVGCSTHVCDLVIAGVSAA